MVDFNNSETIGTPALDIVRVLILERRYNLMESFESYKRAKSNGVEDLQPELSSISSRLLSFYFEIQETASRHLTPESKETLNKAFESEDFNDLFEAFKILNSLLDKLHITKIDIKQALPPMSRPELRNQAKGR